MNPIKSIVLVACLILFSLNSAQGMTPPKVIQISLTTTNNVTQTAINDRVVDDDMLDTFLGKLAVIDSSQTIIIRADRATAIGALVQAIQHCRSKGLTDMRIFTTASDKCIELTVGDEKYDTPEGMIWAVYEGTL